jgi:putative ABC transport system permease protein
MKFDLEKAIRNWKKGLHRQGTMEDGDVAELEAHLRDSMEQYIEDGLDARAAFVKSVQNIGAPGPIGGELHSIHSTSPSWMPSLMWNYVKLALRKMKRHKGYSFINIAGLATGMACCLFILLYVQFELSFDDFHKDIDRLYIVGSLRISESGRTMEIGNMVHWAPTLKDRYPQVEAAGRVTQGWLSQVRYQDRIFKEEDLWNADPGVFEVLTIPFIQGDPRTALNRKNTAVIAAATAEKYFLDKDPMGRQLNIEGQDYEITGIVQNPPANSVFRYKIIKSWATVADEDHFQGWEPGMTGIVTVIKLKPKVDPRIFEEEIRLLPYEFCGEKLKKQGTDMSNFLLAARDARQVSMASGEIRPSASRIYVYIFSVVGFLILLIACMNYMNLATARSANRAAEVGMRKVVGAQKRQIIKQFLGESLVVVFFALASAVALVQLFLPYFNTLANTRFESASLLQPGIILGAIGLYLIVGVAAGSYPAFVLSAFKPIAVLGGAMKSGSRGKVMRRILVVSQFAISIALIIGTIIIYRQITFMKNQPLGFDKDQKLVVMLRDWDMISENYEAVKSEFLRHPNVLNATATSGVPGSMINRTWVFPAGEEDSRGQAFRSLRCDHDFTKVYGIEMVAGRHFNKEIRTDTHQAFIINESGVKAFGWNSPEEAIGKKLWEERYRVIGVAKDYHWWGLQREIEPMIMRVVPGLFRSLTFTIRTTGTAETIGFLEQTYQELFQGDLFEYFFVDTNFDLQYNAEERLGRLFQTFTGLGILIACLGLIGLASFIAEQRTKEIGIRKVLGAPVSGIVYLLSKEFTRWVLIANLVAWPAAYYSGRVWLKNFAYKAHLGWEIFVISAVLALVIAVLSVSYQALKAAMANPIESLRYE